MIKDSTVSKSDELKGILSLLSKNAHGICVVIDDNKCILGTITDGDCRRALMKGGDLHTRAEDVMNTRFFAVDESFSLDQIYLLMKANEIQQVPIVNGARQLIDIVSMRTIKKAEARKNKVVILAGGKGMRLRPLTEDTPKPMLPVKGKPMVQILLERLVNHNFTDIVMAVNYLGHKLEEYFADGSRWSCHISYLKEETELGTGGPLKLLKEAPSHPILVVNGDLMTNVDFEACVDFHNAGKFDLTVGITHHRIQIPFGVVQLSEKDLITGVDEKPVISYPVNAGVYVVNPELLDRIPTGVNYPISTLIQDVIDSGGKVGAFPIHESWCDVGLPDTYAAAQNLDI